MKQLLKITPLAFLAILCFVPFVNAATLAPQPAAPSYQLSVSTRTIGPPPSWFKLYGGTNSEYMYDVVQCSSGGYALVGYTYSYGEGNADVYLVRTDADGNLLWNKTYGGTNYDYGRSVVALSDGFAIAGYSSSFSASYDYWLIRTDLNGNHLWNVTFGGSNSDYGRGLVVSAGGNLTIVGYTYSFGAGSGDVWLVHTNSTGGHLWNETYGGGNYDNGYGLVECTSGGYAICGYTSSFGVGGYDAWLIRTDANGNHLWNQTFGGTNSDYGYSLVECGSGGFAVAGRTYNFGVSSGAAWLIRADASGNHMWNHTYDEVWNEEAYSVIEYSEGGFVLAGSSGVEPGRNGPPVDGLLIRTDSSGNMLWNRTYGGADNDRYRAVVECSNGDLVTAGDTNSFGASGYQGWLVKTGYPLAWSPALTDQTVPFSAPLSYDINVSSWFGVDTWIINDTTNFAISSAGIVSNSLILPSGVFGLRVSVNDSLGSEITGEFSVIIEPRIFFPIPILFIVGVGLIAVILVLLVYFFMSKRES